MQKNEAKASEEIDSEALDELNKITEEHNKEYEEWRTLNPGLDPFIEIPSLKIIV